MEVQKYIFGINGLKLESIVRLSNCRSSYHELNLSGFTSGQTSRAVRWTVIEQVPEQWTCNLTLFATMTTLCSSPPCRGAQLARQSSLPPGGGGVRPPGASRGAVTPPGGASTPTGSAGRGSLSPPGLPQAARSGSGAKEVILNWVQLRLKDYPVSLIYFHISQFLRWCFSILVVITRFISPSIWRN